MSGFWIFLLNFAAFMFVVIAIGVRCFKKSNASRTKLLRSNARACLLETITVIGTVEQELGW